MKAPNPPIPVPQTSIAEINALQSALPEAKFAIFYSSGDRVTLGPKEYVRSIRVSPSFFDVVGSWPLEGGFGDSDFGPPTALRPAVLSYRLWTLTIVGTGILGLVAMTTARRTRELGIRLAIGATRQRIIRQILSEQASAVTAGMVSGGVVAVWTVRFVRAYLYKTEIFDIGTWLGSIALLLLVTLSRHCSHRCASVVLIRR
jgi:hypothetical protein